jgi:hypothetical protein
VRIAADDDGACRPGERRELAVLRVFDLVEKVGGGNAPEFSLGAEQDVEFWPFRIPGAGKYLLQ